LNLARLRQIAPNTRIWGLSATIGNLEEAMLALLGPSRQGHLIAVRAPRRILIETALPPHIERFARAGHLGFVAIGPCCRGREHGEIGFGVYQYAFTGRALARGIGLGLASPA
jgi:hypothetical protein